MPLQRITRAILVALISLYALPGQGSDPSVVVGWYNGNWDPNIPGIRNIYISAVSEGSSNLLYDDFLVPAGGWTVDGALSYNQINYDDVTRAYWEIRSGVSETAGTLIASGINSAKQIVVPDSLDSLRGLRTYRIEVEGLRVSLPAGRFWLAVAPLGRAGLQSYICPTSGLHAVGEPKGNNGNAFYGSPAAPPFRPPGTFAHSRAHDFALGVIISRPTGHASPDGQKPANQAPPPDSWRSR